eukprot:Amastigsp_a677414_6.p1 type:complete len:229 gc:universal Amastigsp_a677414_6:99-785(+)
MAEAAASKVRAPRQTTGRRNLQSGAGSARSPRAAPKETNAALATRSRIARLRRPGKADLGSLSRASPHGTLASNSLLRKAAERGYARTRRLSRNKVNNQTHGAETCVRFARVSGAKPHPSRERAGVLSSGVQRNRCSATRRIPQQPWRPHSDTGEENRGVRHWKARETHRNIGPHGIHGPRRRATHWFQQSALATVQADSRKLKHDKRLWLQQTKTGVSSDLNPSASL